MYVFLLKNKIEFNKNKLKFTLGATHKLRHALRGGGGRRTVTLCDKGGRDPKFCDITFQK